MVCPAGAGRSKRDGADAGCVGFTVDAELHKPVKQQPAAAPRPAAAAAAKQPAAAAAKKAAPPGLAGQGGTRKSRKAPGSGMNAGGGRSASAAAAPPPARPAAFPRASRDGGSGSDKGPPKPQRPPELQLCWYAQEGCRLFNCRFCHSEVGVGGLLWACTA